METVSSIIRDTTLSANDVDYLKKLITPVIGGGKRGVKQKWTKEAKVEFAIVGRYMSYGIIVKEIEKIILSIRKLPEWNGLFTEGNLKTDALAKHTHSYIYLYNADPSRIRIMLNKKEELFGLGRGWRDVLIIDISDCLSLAMPDR